MIITCTNCFKKFNINADLIPEKGRLLQCNGCNHKWFFKNEIAPELNDTTENENLKIFNNESVKENKSLVTDIDLNTNNEIKKPLDEIKEKKFHKKDKDKKKSTFLNWTIIFIISFVAFIVLIDTFKLPISKIFPDIEFLLYNLYESFKDITLFIKDLI